jgi:LmbE family N-acetylglucosaminyl deacetylase
MPGLEETDHYVDVTATVDRQVRAVLCHRSQFLRPAGAPDGPPRWAPERLAMVSSMRARLRQLGERSGHGYRFAERLRRISTTTGCRTTP